MRRRRSSSASSEVSTLKGRISVAVCIVVAMSSPLD
jgi:hypothetical protein